MNAESKLLVTATGGMACSTVFTVADFPEDLPDVAVFPIRESILNAGLGKVVAEAVTGTGLQGIVLCAELVKRFRPSDILARSAGGNKGTAGGKGDR